MSNTAASRPMRLRTTPGPTASTRTVSRRRDHRLRLLLLPIIRLMTLPQLLPSYLRHCDAGAQYIDRPNSHALHPAVSHNLHRCPHQYRRRRRRRSRPVLPRMNLPTWRPAHDRRPPHYLLQSPQLGGRSRRRKSRRPNRRAYRPPNRQGRRRRRHHSLINCASSVPTSEPSSTPSQVPTTPPSPAPSALPSVTLKPTFFGGSPQPSMVPTTTIGGAAVLPRRPNRRPKEQGPRSHLLCLPEIELVIVLESWPRSTGPGTKAAVLIKWKGCSCSSLITTTGPGRCRR